MNRILFLSSLETIKWIFISQFILIGFHIVFSFILKSILISKTRRKKEKREVFKHRIIDAIVQKKVFPFNLVPKSLHSISFLIPLILQIDADIKESYWQKVREHIFQSLLFSQAKKLTYANKWTKRVQAVGCFLHCPDINNEKEILILLQDQVPIIQYSAAACAAKLGTSKSVNAVLDIMNCKRFLRYPFLEALLRGSPNIFSHIETRLDKETDPFIKVSCLEVLSHKMTSHAAELAKKNLHVSHKNLRIAAIRALGHYNDSTSISSLTLLLKDSEWEVRSIAARALGYLKAKEALADLLTLLNDPNWWVRINTALALKRMGTEGIEILKKQDPKKDQYAYEAAQYALGVALYE